MASSLQNVKFIIQIAVVKLLQESFPVLAAKVFSKMWFKVTKFKPNSDLESWKGKCQQKQFGHRNTKLEAYIRINDRPRGQILFIHGWSGRWDQFLEMATRLYEVGYNIISFDLPAHGENPGDNSDVYEFAESIHNLNKTISLGNTMVICHSAGFLAWSLFCKTSKLKLTKKLILISCPAEFDYLINVFATQLKFKEVLISELWKIVGKRCNTLTPKELLATKHMSEILDENVLIIHDKNDKSVEFCESNKLKKIWPNAQVVATENLGHNRILKSEDMIFKISKFCQSVD